MTTWSPSSRGPKMSLRQCTYRCTHLRDLKLMICSAPSLNKGIKDTIIYNEAGVKERFGFLPKFLTDFKGLRGDPSDNIIGISGIGEKTATELIVNFGKKPN